MTDQYKIKPVKLQLFFLPFLFFFFQSAIVNAQNPFEKTYGGTANDHGYSVQQTTDGGYIITGKTKSFGVGAYDVYLVKTDANGDTLWTRTFGGSDDDEGRSVRQTSDGGYVVAGTTKPAAFRNYVYLIKTDSNGDTLWTKTIGDVNYHREGYSVRQTIDGGYVIAGGIGIGSALDDVYLIKTDANGDTLWTKTFDETSMDEGHSIQQTTDGGYIIAGNTSNDIYLIKTDSNGDTLWTKTYGATGDDWARDVQQTTDGGYVIAGHSQIAGGGSDDMYLLKTDANGNTVFGKAFGGTNYAEGNSVLQNTDGDIVTVGFTYNIVSGNVNVYLVKTDVDGNLLGTKTYGGAGGHYGNSVQQTADGGYVIVGSTTSGAGGFDVYLIKTDPWLTSNINQHLTSEYHIVIYPNPNTGEFTLNISTGSAPLTTGPLNMINVSIKLYQITGQQIFAEEFNNSAGFYSQQIDLSKYARGMYYVQVVTGDSVFTRKVVYQ